MTKTQIENRIKEIDRNMEMIFFKDILDKLKLEKEELLRKREFQNEQCK